MRRTGRYRECIYLAVAALTLGTGLMIDFKTQTSWPEIVFAILIFGFGVGIGFQAPILALHALIEDEREVASATGMMIFLRTIGVAAFLVIFQSVFSNVVASQEPVIQAALPANVSLYFTHGNAAANIDKIGSPALDTHQRAVVKHAFQKGLQGMWIVGTALCGLLALLSLGIGNKKLTAEFADGPRTGLRQATSDRDEDQDGNRGASEAVELHEVQDNIVGRRA